MIQRKTLLVFLSYIASIALFAANTSADEVLTSDGPTSSLMAKALAAPTDDLKTNETPHALQKFSMFAIVEAQQASFHVHDLIQIIVSESSKGKLSHKLDSDKEYDITADVSAWPALSLRDLLNLQVAAGRTTGLPRLDIGFSSEFSGQGKYDRKDDFTARLTAEVIEVLPNGNLVLEARSYIKLDEEESTITVTGICRPNDISANNTILSHSLHDLKIEKMNKGELKNANQKGILSKVLDAVFAF
ncbi:MAG: flagellar basal body L-ring protein FlgH [Planctomycetes bacterium]|nr:flagellar basal body L-ring protein FlgH [Planctomycetota bacterium]